MKKFIFAVIAATLMLFGCNKDNPNPPTPPTPPVADDFEITITDLSYTEVTLTVKANDEKMPLFFGIFDLKEYESFENDEDFIDAKMADIRRIAEMYGLSLEELLASELKVGIVENYKFDQGLTPDTDYIAYAFGLSYEGEVLTALNKKGFKTLAVGQEDCTFKIEEVDVKATSFKFSIEPSNPKTKYYYDVLSAQQYAELGSSDDAIRTAVETLIKLGVEEYGLTVEEAVKRMVVSGFVESEEFTEEMGIRPNTEWYAYAIGLGPDGTFTTDPETFCIRTLTESSNTFKTEMGQVGPDYATVNIYPEDKWETYAFLTIADKDMTVDGNPMSEEEVIEYMLGNENTMSANGDNAVTEYKLIPNTDYTTCIIGYADGMATTAVTMQKFTTKAPVFYEDAVFTIISSNITKNDIRWTVRPSDDNITYYYDAMLESDYQAKGANDDVLKQDIKEGIAYYSEQFGMTEQEFIYNHIVNGEIQVDRNGSLKPKTEYRFYVVGMYADGTLTTSIQSAVASTLGDDEPMSFTLSQYGEQYYLWGYPPMDFSCWYWIVTMDDEKYESYTDEQLFEALNKEFKQTSSSVSYYPGLPKEFNPAENTLYIYYVVYTKAGNPGAVHRVRCVNGQFVE